MRKWVYSPIDKFLIPIFALEKSSVGAPHKKRQRIYSQIKLQKNYGQKH